ncbi:hypothetical protein TTHERM_000011599 (macronuclear) [Tetrahymena thermophila SB210]|uniref:Uncharacterized protein n=1 Tax=Tetrahymena thermophila (strain SB210) TaxID=312017 RepID=W7XGZ0_TETTS|nr:hypothetical protein TTHERM_000011599 [Tetrahymena thermophila SB210]EWS76338.1 hypothetical protein TTHERM_000011599 [Tetrahymena thermophila SB210]|eukprot:XP_012651122.1 hypothetical protein TTHERM_000011599 [Tetrahymena thermophila SB210]
MPIGLSISSISFYLIKIFYPLQNASKAINSAVCYETYFSTKLRLSQTLRLSKSSFSREPLAQNQPPSSTTFDEPGLMQSSFNAQEAHPAVCKTNLQLKFFNSYFIQFVRLQFSILMGESGQFIPFFIFEFIN